MFPESFSWEFFGGPPPTWFHLGKGRWDSFFFKNVLGALLKKSQFIPNKKLSGGGEDEQFFIGMGCPFCPIKGTNKTKFLRGLLKFRGGKTCTPKKQKKKFLIIYYLKVFFWGIQKDFFPKGFFLSGGGEKFNFRDLK